MRKTITLLASALVASTAFAASPVSQPVKYMEISFGCQNLKPVMNEFAINYAFQGGEERLAADSRLQIDGDRLELVGVNEERAVVIGVLHDTPTCAKDDENPVDGTPSWNAITLSPMVNLTASMATSSSCAEVTVSSPYLPENTVLKSECLANPEFVEEIHDIPISTGGMPEYSHVQVSITNLDVTSEGHGEYLLKAASGTEWTGAQAQFTNVQEITLQLNDAEDAAEATIYQVDGNSMGAVKSSLHLSCGNAGQSLDCETFLENGNRLAVVFSL